ncbi:MAG: ABC transporter substrate-binding protein [Bacteroidales bacterium]|jgi:iron complex transport system substrate-binding protein|nr:ABC transporter substrate-binding protein [Bacteroidales bacterium]
MAILRFLQYLLLSVGFITGFASCTGQGQHTAAIPTDVSSDSAMVEYAQGFTLEKQGDITLLTVSNPWQGAKNVVYRYALCPKGKEVPAEYSQYTTVFTPVERVICLSTTHVAMLSALGKTSSIKALSGAAFVSDSTVHKAIDTGQVIDIGYDRGLNYEKIISLKPDVIFAYGVGEEVTGSMARLTSLGQKVIFNAEYLERTALGKAEWIKFMAVFYNCEEQAVQKFGIIRDEYESLRNLVKSNDRSPKILCGLPWQGIWYIPGGETWMAAMIADAGGQYLWKDNPSRESIPVNIETIVNQGGTADLWINTGAARTLAEIRSVDERLSLIKPFQAGAVYNNYARASAGGGNDFFESGVVNPHIILKDMIRIFHPDLLPDHHLYYYVKLE